MNKRSFLIRRATVGDTLRLARLATDLFSQTFGPHNRPEDLATYLGEAFGESQQRNELAAEAMVTWLAEDEAGDAIGYVQLRLGARAASVTAERPAELARIYADRHWHGEGVGGTLLDTCIAAAASWGADVLWLGVWERNPRAIAFYEKHGFRVVGEQSFDLGADRQRDLVMVRDVSSSSGASVSPR
jgi:GNAT superfamily N-acetyltransferase